MSMGCLTRFFFQAEAGIRYIGVTGVQTCALPISRAYSRPSRVRPRLLDRGRTRDGLEYARVIIGIVALDGEPAEEVRLAGGVEAASAGSIGVEDRKSDG